MKKRALILIAWCFSTCISVYSQDSLHLTGYKEGDKAFITFLERYLNREVLDTYGQNHLFFACIYIGRAGTLDSVSLLRGYDGDPKQDAEYIAEFRSNLQRFTKNKWLASERDRVLVVPLIFYFDDLWSPQKPYSVPIIPSAGKRAMECVFVTPVFIKGMGGWWRRIE